MPTVVSCSWICAIEAPSAGSTPRRYLTIACSRSTTSNLRVSGTAVILTVVRSVEVRQWLLACPAAVAEVGPHVWGRAAVMGDPAADVHHGGVPDGFRDTGQH